MEKGTDTHEFGKTEACDSGRSGANCWTFEGPEVPDPDSASPRGAAVLLRAGEMLELERSTAAPAATLKSPTVDREDPRNCDLESGAPGISNPATRLPGLARGADLGHTALLGCISISFRIS